jgi:SAM-dependent methyltransferase
VALSVGDRARLDFVLFARRAWADTVYPALVDDVRGAAPGAAAVADSPEQWEQAVKDVSPAVHGAPLYPFFAWLERGLQKQLWRTVSDIVAAERSGADGSAGATKAGSAGTRGRRRAAPKGDGGGELVTLELHPELDLPEYYTSWDFHLQPGGVWRDVEHGLVYQLGARVVMLGANDGAEFHRLFTRTAVPERKYRRIVDLGCGFGKSTFPLKEAHPEAEVVGVDLAAPLLELAKSEAEHRRLGLRLVQSSCTATGIETGSADLVTATMLVHELPPEEIRATLAEAARVLAPGGLLRVLDFQPTGDPVRDLAMSEHSERNNEPFMRELFRADVAGWCGELGLGTAGWAVFDERGAGRLPPGPRPERREWHFPWAVLEATRQ